MPKGLGSAGVKFKNGMLKMRRGRISKRARIIDSRKLRSSAMNETWRSHCAAFCWLLKPETVPKVTD